MTAAHSFQFRKIVCEIEIPIQSKSKKIGMGENFNNSSELPLGNRRIKKMLFYERRVDSRLCEV